MRNSRKIISVAALTAMSMSSGVAKADFWGGFFSGQWTLGGNWTDLSAPGPADAANFQGPAPINNTFVNLDANQTVLSMFVSAQAGVADFQFSRTNNAVLTVTNGLTNSAPAGESNSTLFNGFRVNTGTVTLQGDSTLTLSGGAVATSTGELRMREQADLIIGASTFNAGTLVMTADNTLVVNSGGAMNITGGGFAQVLSGTLTVNGTGTLNVGGILNAQGTGFVQFNREYVVPAGRGFQAIAGGSVRSTSFIDVAAAGSGTMAISGAGSSIVVGSGGSAVTDWGAGGTATITFDNSGTGDFNTGLRIGNGGTARVSVLSGAFLNVDQGLQVAGQSSITINSAGLTSTGTTIIGGASTINLQSGSLNFNGNGTLGIASTINHSGGALKLGNSGSTFTVDGGIVNNTAGGQSLPNGVTLRVLGGGKFFNNSFYDIATGNATGTLLVADAGSDFTTAGTTDWGWDGGNAATVNFSNDGAGTFGTLRMSNSGGATTLTLNSNGRLNTTTSLITGNFAGTSAVRINIAGGTLNSIGTANFLGGTTVSLSSGGLILNGNSTFNTGATLNKSGGALNLTPGRTLAFAGGAGSISGNYALPNGSTLRVSNGGRLDLGSFLDIANGAATGTLAVDGANSRITALGTSDWGANAGNTSTVTFSNSGAGTFSSLRLSRFGGASNLSISTDASLTASNFEAGSTGATANIQVNGGSLNSLGQAIFANGANVSVTGTGVLRLGGNSTFLTGSTFIGSPTGGLERASNTTLAFDGGVGTFTPTFDIADGQTMRVTNGGSFTAVERLRLAAFSGSGTLLVDGVNSKFQTLNAAANFTNLAQNIGTDATMTISNSGIATFATAMHLASNGGNATINVQSGGILNTPGIFTTFNPAPGTAVINVNGGTLRTTGDSNLNSGATLNYAAGTVNIGGTLGVGIVNPNARVLLTPGGNKVLRVGGLNIPAANLGQIDLSDNDMIIDYTGATPFDTIRGYLFTGRNGGAWNGNGISSSTAALNPTTALGFAEASEIGSPATFFGQPIDATTLLTRYTLIGDADLSGAVSLDDFTALAASFGQPNSRWTRGDFNYDTFTNLDDFTALAANFGLNLPADLPRGAAVPEPAAGLVLIALAGLASRSRRRRR